VKLKAKVIRVVRLLEKEYHSPRHFNKKNPLNEYLFILLSLRTDERMYNKIYKEFKHKYPRWSYVYKDNVDNISTVLYSCGLAKQKARRLKKALKKIMHDFGFLSLKKIKKYSDDQMEQYLLSLPGIGLKSAKCMMLYSFDCKVLPIDTHTFRISNRLGFIKRRYAEAKNHKVLDKIIPPDLRYTYHVNCVAHGRTICKSVNPKCGFCIIEAYCTYNNK
jgi:endonuclease III